MISGGVLELFSRLTYSLLPLAHNLPLITRQIQLDLPEHGSFPALDSETSAANKNVFMINLLFSSFFSLSQEKRLYSSAFVFEDCLRFLCG